MTEFARERSKPPQSAPGAARTRWYIFTWSLVLVIYLAPIGLEELSEDGCELGDGDISSSDDHVMRDVAIGGR